MTTPERRLLREFPGIRFEKDYNDWLFKRDALLAQPEGQNAAGQVACVKSADGSGESIREAPSVLPRSPQPAPAAPAEALHQALASAKTYTIAGEEAEMNSPRDEANSESDEQLFAKARAHMEKYSAAASLSRELWDATVRIALRSATPSSASSERAVALLRAIRDDLTDRADADDGVVNLSSGLWYRLTDFLATLPAAPQPASATSFNAIRDAIAVRMGGHTIPTTWNKAWDTFMFLLRDVKASECAVSETAPSRTAKVPEVTRRMLDMVIGIDIEDETDARGFWAAVFRELAAAPTQEHGK